MKEEFCRVSTCPITKTAGLLSDTWTMLIVRAVMKEGKRFSEIEAELDGISTRTLSMKLKSLLAEGLVKKQKNGAYTATAKGEALRGILVAMGKYGKKYLSK